MSCQLPVGDFFSKSQFLRGFKETGSSQSRCFFCRNIQIVGAKRTRSIKMTVSAAEIYGCLVSWRVVQNEKRVAAADKQPCSDDNKENCRMFWWHRGTLAWTCRWATWLHLPDRLAISWNTMFLSELAAISENNYSAETSKKTTKTQVDLMHLQPIQTLVIWGAKYRQLKSSYGAEVRHSERRFRKASSLDRL